MKNVREEYDRASIELSDAELNYQMAEDLLIKARRRHAAAARLLDESLYGKPEQSFWKIRKVETQ